MTIDQAIKESRSAPQPEGKDVAEAYSQGKLDGAIPLHVIAYLLRKVNEKESSHA